MKQKLTVLILMVTLPILFFMAWFMSERSFTLSMEREKQRTQMTESIVFREVQKTMIKAEYTSNANITVPEIDIPLYTVSWLSRIVLQ